MSCCKRKKPPEVYRCINRHVLFAPNVAHPYCDNTVRNSKYTLLTFVPLNLWQQFTQPINFYFLVVAALQFVPIVAPVNPLTTLGPLVFAFALTAIKEGYDDLQRHRRDKEFNTRKFKILSRQLGDSSTLTIPSRNIRVGDLVLLRSGEEVPCDLVALLSSNPDEGVCYLSTESLDGETAAKQKNCALNAFFPADVAGESDEEKLKRARDFLASMDAVVYCEGPGKSFTRFTGRVEYFADPSSTKLEPNVVSCDIQTLLLATSIIRTTSFVIGIAAYTGDETRVGLSKRTPPNKHAQLDQLAGKYAKFIFVLQFLLVVLASVLGSLQVLEHKGWYLGDTNPKFNALFSLLILPIRFFLLISVMVPISYKVTVDISKYYISLLIGWDESMKDTRTGQNAEVNNSALAEDLGQIEYIMSDKTGTLTENAMDLQYIVVRSKVYTTVMSTPPKTSVLETECSSEEETTHIMTVLGEDAANPRTEQNLELRALQVLLLCNSVTPNPAAGQDGSSSWTSTSPDEIAFVDGAARCGATLLERTRLKSRVQWMHKDTEIEYEHLYSNAFTSERSRMSVVVRDLSNGQILLLVKGADERVLPLCTVFDDGEPLSVEERLMKYSCRGLRSLVLAFRILSESELQEWGAKYQEAAIIQGEAARNEAVAQVVDALECNLTLIGITAVEDKLQEDVPETLAALRAANIRVAMITGDKSQTARQIGLSSGLLRATDRIVDLTIGAFHDSAERHDELNKKVEQAMTEQPRLRHLHLGRERCPWYEKLALMDPIRSYLRRRRINELFLMGSRAIVNPLIPELKATDAATVSDRSDSGNVKAPLMADVTAPCNGFALIVNGEAIAALMEHDDLLPPFRELFLASTAAICCRVTPTQKAFITRMVKETGRMTCAVGDGGNDVAMIQEAAVGVGIAGHEGRQAARAADFSIPQFRCLQTLLLVHGHLSFHRTSYVVQYSFYKSMILAAVQYTYNSTTLFSGDTFWNSFSLTTFNGVYTLPLAFFYVMDVPLSAKMLLTSPSLYQLPQRSAYFNSCTFFLFIFRGILHAMLIYYGTVYFFSGTALLESGRTIEKEIIFIPAFTVIIVLQVFIVLCESHSVTWVHWLLSFTILGPIVVYGLSFYVYNLLKQFDFFMVFNEYITEGYFHLGSALILSVTAATFFLVKPFTYYFFPNEVQLQRVVWRRKRLEERSSFLSSLIPRC